MPFLFIIVGSVFVVSAVRNTTTELTGLLKSDFTGSGNFIYWAFSILVIGAVGYIPDLKPISRWFMALVVIVLFIANKGVFQEFYSALNETQTGSLPAAQSGSGSTASATVNTGTNIGNILGSLS